MHRPTYVAALAMLVAAANSSGLWAAAPVARILAARGTVAIRTPEGKQRPAAVYGSLFEGEAIRLAAQSELTVAFRGDGHHERLTVSGERKVTADGCLPAQGIEKSRPAIKNTELSARWVRELPPLAVGAVTVARAEKTKASPRLTPIVGSTILEDRPTFRWPIIQGVASYSVEVLSLTQEVLWEHKTPTTMAVYPGEPALRPAFAYRWVVYGHQPNAPRKHLFAGEFSRATAGQAGEAEQMAKLLGADAGPANRALAALWYEQNGLYAESIGQYEVLAKSTRQPVFLAALSELYARAGRTEEADQARTQAAKAGFDFAAVNE